jgi:DNA-binding MarR family transcriptional regulator
MGHIDPKFQGWYGALQATMRSLEKIEQEVEAETGLPMSWVELLFYLCKDEEHDGRWRMGELADMTLLSRGGVTRLVARMEEAGLVRRETPPENRRITYAVITEKGAQVMEKAGPIQKAAVERYFGAAITDDEAESLRQISVRVLELVGERCDWVLKDLTATHEA